MLDYRPDIDGLRAIAVLAAVFFHGGFVTLQGGFVGVELFFVVSGYLITSQLLYAMGKGTFVFSTFYERRVRRLLPAVIPVMLFSIAVAVWRLSPQGLVDFSGSLVSLFLFASNIFFMYHDGYFDESSHSTLLLHTWSLSVEEQYYLLFPAFLMVMHCFAKKRITLAIAVVLVSSLAFSMLAVETARMNLAFYHPLSRFWELMIGSLLATGIVRPKMSDIAANVVSGICLAVIVASLALISRVTPYPGAAALPAALATAGIILCGQRNTTLVYRLLASRPFVFFGKISYSLYLWHWPVMGLLRMGEKEPSQASLLASILISIAIATLSYYFIENPFRTKAILKRQRTVFVALALSILFFCGVGLLGRALDGLPQRFSLDIARYTKQVERDRNWAEFRYHQCFLGFVDTKEQFEKYGCLRLEPAKKNVLILGDSHAAQLYYGLKNRFPDVNFMQITSFSCSPDFYMEEGSKLCAASNKEILEHWLKENRIDGLILAARWEDRKHVDRMIGQLSRFEGLAGEVVLVGPAPRLERALAPIDLISGFKRLDGAEQEINKHLRPEIFEFDQAFAQALAHGKVHYISLLDLLCKGKDCRQFDDMNAPLMMDNNHITIEGSTFLAKGFDEFVGQGVMRGGGG